MFSAKSLTLFALISTSFAQLCSQTADFCRPAVFNGPQVITDSANPNTAWQASYSSPSSPQFIAINLASKDASSTLQQWVFSQPATNNNVQIIANANKSTTACTTSTGGPLDSEDCTNPSFGGPQVLTWFLTCNECDSTNAGTGHKGCAFQSAFEGQCASISDLSNTVVTGQDCSSAGNAQLFDITPVSA